MFVRRGPKFQCLEGQSQNFNDSKDKKKKSNAWKYKVRNPMFGRIRSEFQCLEGLGHKFNLWKDRTRNPVVGRIRKELQCLKGSGQNSNVWKDKVRIRES